MSKEHFIIINGLCPRCNRAGKLKHRVDTGYDICFKCIKELQEIERIKAGKGN